MIRATTRPQKLTNSAGQFDGEASFLRVDCVSVCRLITETFLPTSQPVKAAVSVFFMLCSSMIKNALEALRPPDPDGKLT